jgi:hypothetical protein
MEQPVPLKQIDLSFLPQGGASEDDAEEDENEDEEECEPLRQRGRKALSSGDARAPAKNREASEVKNGARLLGKRRVATLREKPPPASAPASADSIAKPPFAQDDENALQDLQHFLRGRKKTARALARKGGDGDRRALDGVPRAAGRAAASSPREGAGRQAEVGDSIATIEEVVPMVGAGRRSCVTARLPAHRLTSRCRPALARLSRSEVQPGAFCVMRVAPAS